MAGSRLLSFLLFFAAFAGTHSVACNANFLPSPGCFQNMAEAACNSGYHFDMGMNTNTNCEFLGGFCASTNVECTPAAASVAD